MSKIVSSMLDDQQALAFVRELLDSDLSVPYDSGYFELVTPIGSIGFTGAGFSGFGADLPSTGFITEIDYYSTLREFTLTGGLISVSALKAAVLASDAAAVGALLFGTNDTLSGSSISSVVLHGFGGHDTITGSTSNDQLFGDEGSDILRGDMGDDILDGGAGNDTASFAFSSLYVGQTTGVNVDLRIQSAQNTGHGNDVLRGIENVWGTPNADTLRGDDGLNILDGYGGKDQLYGYGGDDVLYSDGTGVADGGAGYDTLSFLRWHNHGYINRILTVDLGKSGEQEVANTDYPFYSPFLLTVTNIERLDGSPYADSFKSGPGGGYLFGGGGSDSLSGLAGNDTLQGGTGDDTITEISGSNYLRGDDGNDSISGGSGFDDANGNVGNDTISTGAGNDYSVGGKDNDLLYGDDGSDIVWGNLGNDTCDGGIGDDQCRGGQGDDSVSGAAGNDFVSGDRGNDAISGGAGADIFHGSQDAGIDRVLDFHVSEGDRVQLDPGTTYTLSQVGSDTVLDMGAGNQMILVGVQLSTLAPGWVFGA
jgi:Ca2+-binding RTX toxin-like protein